MLCIVYCLQGRKEARMIAIENIPAGLNDKEALEQKIELLRDVVTHLLNDTIEASLPEARDLAHMAQNVDELSRQLQQLKNAL